MSGVTTDPVCQYAFTPDVKSSGPDGVAEDDDALVDALEAVVVVALGELPLDEDAELGLEPARVVELAVLLFDATGLLPGLFAPQAAPKAE